MFRDKNSIYVIIIVGIIIVASFVETSITVGQEDTVELLWKYSADDTIMSTAISSNGTRMRMVAGSKDNNLYFFYRNTTDPLIEVYTNDDVVSSVAISSDGWWIFAGSWDGTMRFFHGSYALRSWHASDIISSVSISSDGSYAVAGSYNNKIYVYHAVLLPSLIWKYNTTGYVWKVVISSDSNYIAAISTTDTVGIQNLYLFETKSEQLLWNITGSFWDVSISANGEYLAVEGRNELYLFHKDSTDPVWSYHAKYSVNGVSISSDGNYIIAGTTTSLYVNDNHLYLFNKESNIPIWNYTTSGDFYATSISKSGEYIAAGDDEGYFYLFRKNNNIPIFKYLTTGVILCVSMSSSGNYTIVGSDNNVYLFYYDLQDLEIAKENAEKNPTLFWIVIFIALIIISVIIIAFTRMKKMDKLD